MAGTAASNLRAVAIEVRKVPQTSMIAAVKAAKKVAADVGAAAGSPLKGKKRRGLKLRARDDLRPLGDGWSARIQGVSPAGWVWITSGTRPHAIRRRKRGPMRRMTVHHPGTSPRGGGWRAVTARLEVIVPAIVADTLADAIRGA